MVHASLLYLLTIVSAIGISLPIYFEDSHAGSFGFFADTLELEQPHTLILIDAHSDASGIANSDDIRSSLREVNSPAERKKTISKLRNQGILQPYNWIEPLMPTPFDQVLWIAGKTLTHSQKQALQKEAANQLDWKAELNKRTSGELGHRYQVINWKELKDIPLTQPVVVSIDLDYFTHLDHPLETLHTIWTELLKIPKLKAISFSLSRPWQTNDAQAEKLFHHAFRHALSVSNAQIYYNPYLTDLHDRSEKAKTYYQQGKLPPRFDITKASNPFKNLLLQHTHRIKVSHHPHQWENLLEQWKHDLPNINLIIPHQHQSIDQVWRLTTTQINDIWIDTATVPPDKKIKKINWWLIEPEQASYNIITHTSLGKGFTGDAIPYITKKKRLLATTHDPALSADTWTQELHSEHHIGILRIQAEIITDTTTHLTSTLELRVRNQTGFLGSLEEQFGSPYVFGIGAMHNQNTSTTGPETLVGNDCANFLIYAWRQQGITLPWSNPKQLKNYLTPIKPSTITPTQIKNGIVIHLGSHVAALWKDQGEIGIIDQKDLVIHHLSDFPEIITLKQLTKQKSYRLYQLKSFNNPVTLAIAGDLCLAGKLPYPVLSQQTTDILANADITVANLECAISSNHTEKKDKRFSYIVSPEHTNILTHFDLLTLANNHIGDGGQPAYQDTLTHLTKNNISTVGTGTITQAASIKTILHNDLKIGFIAFNTIENKNFIATNSHPGTACYPEHKSQIELAILTANVDYLIALPHWGNEYTAQVNSRQRHIAKWLIDLGVDFIVGSHTHHLQPIEYYKGKCIAYSLGNFIFSPQSAKGFNDHYLSMIKLSQTTQNIKHNSINIIKLNHKIKNN